MIKNVEKYIEFLNDHKINSNQYIFCYLLALGKFKILLSYIRDNPLLIEELDYLVKSNKIIIVNWDKNNPKYNLKNIRLSDKFKSKLVLDITQAANEIFNNYFNYGYWNDTKVVARDIIFDDFVELYKRTIENDIEEHERILKITKKYVKSREFAEKGLKKYIGTRMYDIIELEQLKNNVEKFGENEL